MNYKKLFTLGLAIALAIGGATIARADNNGNESQEFGRNEREARDVGSTLEVHISNNGKTLVRGAKVTAVATNSITATTTWGANIVTWTVTTDSNTKLIRRYGGSSAMTEIAVGDFISFQGTLSSSASGMTVLAKTVKDWSIQKKNATHEGTVSSISGATFVIAKNNGVNVTVNTTGSTQFMKNNVAGVFADITVGAKVTATGIFNNLTNTLDASKVVIKITQPEAMTKEGKIVSIAGTTAPTTFVLLANGTNYTVKISATTSVLKNNWLAASLTNFAVDNTVRVYGVVNADNTIDATVVRNTNL